MIKLNDTQLQQLTTINESLKHEVIYNILEQARQSKIQSLHGNKKVTSLKKMMKRNKDRYNLKGYSTFNNQYCFTDSYLFIIINDDMEYNEAPTPLSPHSIESIISNYITDLKAIDCDIPTLIASTSGEMVTISNLKFDKTRLAELHHIIGKNADIYINDKVIILENEAGERGMLIQQLKAVK